MPQYLDLIIRAKDEASAAINKMTGVRGTITEATKGLTVAIGGIAAGYTAAKLAYDKFVEPVLARNKALIEMTQATGMTLEEAARVAAVADDFEISMGEITNALEIATKNGFEPSIDSIANLADEIGAMDDVNDRAVYLADLLGRNWAVLLPLLQEGGPAFRELAAAVDEGLIPTETFADDTEELRLRVDALNDSMEVAQNRILEGLIPAFLNGADAAAKFLIQLGLVNASGGIGAGYGDATQFGSRGGAGLGPAPIIDPHTYRERGRASGGPVGPGMPYTVGERGPETFVPNQSGTIVPNNDRLAASVDRLVRTLPTILRDAVQKS